MGEDEEDDCSGVGEDEEDGCSVRWARMAAVVWARMRRMAAV